MSNPATSDDMACFECGDHKVINGVCTTCGAGKPSDEFDNGPAGEEGWGIFDCEGSENGPYQLQRFDEEAIFEDDAQAWKFVADKAKAGSEYHVSAFAYLKANNPIEYDSITKFLGYQPPVKGTYHVGFAAHIGAWMDGRKVGPATRKAYPSRGAAIAAAKAVKARCYAVASYDITFKPEETTNATGQ